MFTGKIHFTVPLDWEKRVFIPYKGCAVYASEKYLGS